MSNPTDDQVWTAMQACQAEAETWRIIEFKGRGSIAVNDLRRAPEIKFDDPVPITASFERHDFKDPAAARQYVEWRSIKAALIAYERTRA